MNPPLGVLSLVGRSLRLAREGFGLLFPIAFAPLLAMTLVSYGLTGGPMAPQPANPFTSPAHVADIIVGLVFSFLLGGPLCLVALDAALDRRHSLGDYLRQTWRHAGALISLSLLVNVAAAVVAGLGTVVGLGIAVASVFAIFGPDALDGQLGPMILGGIAAPFALLPMIYVYARFLPGAAALLFENEGWSALGRAQALTQGYRWPLVWATLLIFLVFVPIGVVWGVLTVRVMENTALSVLVGSVFSAIMCVLFNAFGAVVYLRLREIKDGMSAAAIAETIG